MFNITKTIKEDQIFNIEAEICLLTTKLKDRLDFEWALVISPETTKRFKEISKQRVLERRDEKEILDGTINEDNILTREERFSLLTEEEKENHSKMVSKEKDIYLKNCILSVGKIGDNTQTVINGTPQFEQFFDSIPYQLRNYLFVEVVKFNANLK
jgi:hypothetical protein